VFPAKFKVLRRILIVLVGLVALVGAGRLIQVSLGSLYSGERGPYLQTMSATGVTVRWQTESAERGVVRYGLHPERLEFEAQDDRLAEEHEVRLTNLRPATRYYYTVGTADDVWQGGDDYWFVTAPEPGAAAPVRFWVIGDPGYPGEKADAVTRAALDWMQRHPRPGRPLLDLWLTTGDNAYRSGTNRQYQAALFSPHAELLRNVPIWPAYGNHDARRWAHFNIFTLPAEGEAGGVASGTERYFSFDFGQVHFVMLDSESSDLDTDGAMLEWLQRDLEATQQTWLIAVLHHPPYSKGSHDSDSRRDSDGRMPVIRQNVLPILERGGVDLVLSGHSHMYERSMLLDCHYGDSDSLTPTMQRDAGGGRPDDGGYKKRSPTLAAHEGTVYAVVGSSSKLDQGPLNHPVMVVSKQQMGSLVVDINGPRLDGVFINREGQVADRFAIQKGVPSAPPGRATCPE
jgi:hypothetical protein